MFGGDIYGVCHEEKTANARLDTSKTLPLPPSHIPYQKLQSSQAAIKKPNGTLFNDITTIIKIRQLDEEALFNSGSEIRSRIESKTRAQSNFTHRTLISG